MHTYSQVIKLKSKIYQNNTKLNKNHTKNMESGFCAGQLLKAGPAMQCVSYPEIIHWEYRFSLSQQLSTANSFLVRGEILHPFPLLSAGFLQICFRKNSPQVYLTDLFFRDLWSYSLRAFCFQINEGLLCREWRDYSGRPCPSIPAALLRTPRLHP